MHKEKLRTELSKYYSNENLINYKMKLIDEFDEEIRNELFAYLETGKLSDYVANGWTIEKVADKSKENIIQAFIIFDMIKKDPHFANGFRFHVAGRK